jgi:ubiquitin-protein ligase
MRRLRTDRKGLEHLRSESSIFDFDATGDPCERYVLRFYGRGLSRPEAPHHIAVREMHEVRVKLGASYPRMMPELTWMTPIFHPNISASGVVCLGGYGTHWVPSLSLDELCGMLWDMIRYRNFDVESPYNREAALWAKTQTRYSFPLDERPIRDRVAHGTVVPPVCRTMSAQSMLVQETFVGSGEVLFIDNNCEVIVEAEIVPSEDQEIMFLD